MSKNLPQNFKPLVVIDEELKSRFEKAKQRKIHVDDFIREFLDSFLSPQTKEAYLKDLRFFFGFLAAADVQIHHPREIESHHFRLYRDHMIERSLASATVNRRLVCVRSFIKWAIAAKLMDHNPLDVVKLPKVETQAPTLAFTDQEVIAMIDSTDISNIKGHSHRVMMILLFSLGLRRSELTNIKINDLYQDRNHHVIKIKGKGGKQRHLPLNEKIQNEIQCYLNHLSENGLSLIDDDYLFHSSANKKNNKPINGSTIFRMIQKYARAAGIERRVSPHSCRATAISHLLDTQKTPIRDVASFAGHSQVTTTERYDKKRKGLDDSAAYQIDYKKQA